MKNSILINSTGYEIRIAITQEKKLVELFVKNYKKNEVIGDIYKGIISQINSGLSAAFVDIGMKKSAFLPLSDLTYNTNDIKNIDYKDQEILIQIIKASLGKKGPRATTSISIPGKYTVVMPNRRFVGISKKIKKLDEKKRLKKIVKKVLPVGFGLIIRTEAKGKPDELINEDIERCIALWRLVEKKSKKTEAPVLLHKEEEPVLKILRDYYSITTEKIIVDDKNIFNKISNYLSLISKPKSEKDILELYIKEKPIFENYNIENQINDLFSPIVQLPSKGYIIIEETEALITIDVNSGSSYSNINPEQMAFKTNLEAAKEIARQLRLRNVGGIIVIDFIDMQLKDNRKAIKEELNKYLSQDKASYILSQISEFGLLEMTRKRTSPSILKTFQKKCPYCKMSGYIFANHFVLSSLQRWLINVESKIKGKTIQIRVNNELCEYFSLHLDTFLKKLSKSSQISFQIVDNNNLHGDRIEVWSVNDNIEITNWEGGILPSKI